MSYELKQGDVFDFARSISTDTRQKGDELEFKLCPYCNGGSHRDDWTFSVNLRSGAFKCLRASCGKQGHFVQLCRDFNYTLDFEPVKIYRKLPQVPIKIRDEAVEYMKSRGISEAITRKYEITVQTNNPKILVFPFKDEKGKLVFVKYRKTDFDKTRDRNKEWSMKNTQPILFGMNHCVNFDRLIITEGQIDSLSVAEAGFENAVSVPTGANGFKWLADCIDWVTKFKEIIVFGDCEHGTITLIDSLAARLPKNITVKCVRAKDYLGEKDANDILRKFGPRAIADCIENAEVPKLENVKQLADVQAVDINKMDKIETGIRDLDRVIKGFAMGQLVILTGKRGDGKSTFMSQLIADALHQKRNVFVYSGELADFHFKRWLDYQLAGEHHITEEQNKYGDMDYKIPDDVIEAINDWYRDRAFIYDNTYINDGKDEFESLPDTIERAIKQYGIQLVCIDNLMTAMEKVSEQTNLYLAQSNFVGRLKSIAMKYGVVVILVAHPKKANADSGQDENDLVAGSSDITNKADIVLKYSRCDPEKYDCDSLIKVTKNRLLGVLRTTNESAIRVDYSPKSKRITGVSDDPMADTHKVYGWEKQMTWETEALPF